MEKHKTKQSSILRKFREDLKLTRFQVRQEIGISEKALFSLETGKALPSIETLVSLSRLYQKPLKTMIEAVGVDVTGIPDDTTVNIVERKTIIKHQ